MSNETFPDVIYLGIELDLDVDPDQETRWSTSDDFEGGSARYEKANEVIAALKARQLGVNLHAKAEAYDAIRELCKPYIDNDDDVPPDSLAELLGLEHTAKDE